MKDADYSDRMPGSEIDQKIARILDSEILEKFGFGSSSLDSESKKSFMEWITTFLIAKSPKMQKIIRLIEQISGVDVSVLITGETGTGKESVARAIHYSSKRSERPLVMINCAALPEHLLDSELFGSVESTYPGTVKDRVGRLEVADKGTLFLYEVSKLPLSIQKKLLYFLRESAFKKRGRQDDGKIDVRIIAATSKDLYEKIKRRRFHEGLFYLLNVVQINIPPLRERKDDIPLLVNHFIKKYNLGTGKDIQGISPEALKQLMNYDFPGNIRELENIIQESVSLETSQTIQKVHVSSLHKGIKMETSRDIFGQMELASERKKFEEVLIVGLEKNIVDLAKRIIDIEKNINIIRPVELPDEEMDLKKSIKGLKKSIEDTEKVLILRTLNKTGGSKKVAANLLGISPRTLELKLDRYGLLKTE